MRENRTKIIATIGPKSRELPVLFKMVEHGMDAARLNFSHGTYREFSSMIQNIRLASQKFKKHIAIIQDLQGPKMRVGKLPEEGIMLQKGETVIFGKKGIPLDIPNFWKLMKKNDPVFLADGFMELRVLSTKIAHVLCRVVSGGILKSRKGINLPNAVFPKHASCLTKKDFQDIHFGLKQKVDYIALSFVSSANDIQLLRNMLRRKARHGRVPKIIAKIERKEAIHNLEEIIKVSDAVMVARGDLGLEIPSEMVPLYQKKIIHLANEYGKPVIVATQMLASMVTQSRPTRAEISDAANAIFDHADALMLSDETAVGKYPAEAVAVLYRVATAVEKEMSKHVHLLPFRGKIEELSLTDATCLSAVRLALDAKAKCIIAITKTGYTAREISKYRPFTPIIAYTPQASVARQLSLVWGVTEICVAKINLQNPLPAIKQFLLSRKIVKPKDEIVICNAGFNQKEKLLTTFRF